MNSLPAQCAPVLLLTFNRPEQTFRVFEKIRSARPAQLFISSDGARKDRQDENYIVQDLRRDLLASIDWPCEVKTRFNAQNQGCKMAVSGAVSWFFDHVPAGIILEDDCVPASSFFSFCSELLAYYHHDERVMSISGTNLHGQTQYGDGDYYFSLLGDIWGWASWRRAWRFFDVRIKEWPEWRRLKKMLHPAKSVNDELYTMFDAAASEQNHIWDYQWVFAHVSNGGLGIVSEMNLVQNIGFGADATNTTKPELARIFSVEAREIPFPLTHPSNMKAQVEADIMSFAPPEQKQE